MARDLEGKTILVVGGAGFVGGNLCRHLLAEGPRSLLVVDNLLSGDVGNLPKDERIAFTPSSITEDAVLEGLPDDLDFCFHLACYHGNQASIADPLADHANNTLTSLKLFDRLSQEKGLEAVVYSAAGCAVAEKTFEEAQATQEDRPVSLFHDSPYSISKLIGELYGNYYHQRTGLPFMKARFQNVYGPGEVLGAGAWRKHPATVWRNVTPTFIWKALHQEALPVENGGIASRDFIYVDDICRGLMAIATRGEPGGTYNLASGVETTILELAEAINRLAANETPIALKPARDWDRSGKRFGDPSKARQELGFVAQTSLEEGLARTVTWTRENHERIARTMARHAWFVPEAAGYTR